jgi:hypothetical protein
MKMVEAHRNDKDTVPGIKKSDLEKAKAGVVPGTTVPAPKKTEPES